MNVSLPCTDSDWDGTVTEQTDNHLLGKIVIMKGKLTKFSQNGNEGRIKFSNNA